MIVLVMENVLTVRVNVILIGQVLIAQKVSVTIIAIIVALVTQIV
jgi:hypothetical protein